MKTLIIIFAAVVSLSVSGLALARDMATPVTTDG